MKMKRDILSLREHWLQRALMNRRFVFDKRYFNDRCASIDSAGVYECQVAEENWIYGHFDALPPNFEPLIQYLIADITPDIRLSSIVTSIVSKKGRRTSAVILSANYTKFHILMILLNV